MFAARIHALLLTLLTLVSVGLVFSQPSIAEANADEITVEVQVLLAKDDGSGIPSDLNELRGRLQQQFSQFSGFALDSRQTVTLSLGQSRSVTIPDFMAVTLEYLGETDGRYRLRVTLPGGSANVSAPAGGLFFVGGPELSEGTLILAIRPQ